MSDWTKRKHNLTPVQKPYNYIEMPTFRLGRDVRENIKALRAAMGSATRELSRDDLAALINDEVPRGRPITGSAIRWWEKGRGQPEYRVAAVMARFAGCSFEQFCLGTGQAEASEDLETASRGLTDEEAARALATDERGTRQQEPQRKVAGAAKRRRRP